MEYMTYEEYLKMKTKYKPTTKCGVLVPEPCDKPGLYEGGDTRCWFPMCEEHAHMKDRYILDERMFKPVTPAQQKSLERAEKKLEELKRGKD